MKFIWGTPANERARFFAAAGSTDPETTTPETEEVTETVEEEKEETPWRVILFNDDIHTFDEVIMQIVKATGCTTSHAEKLAWEVHTTGKAAVFEGSFEDCLRVQAVLREIELITEIQG